MLLTLCRQLTLFTQGFDLILHSKYTSAPSCIDDVFELVPSSSDTTGLSGGFQCLLSDVDDDDDDDYDDDVLSKNKCRILSHIVSNGRVGEETFFYTLLTMNI